MRRTPSATPRSCSPTGASCSPATCSDVLVPMLDRRSPGQVDAYEKALERLDEATRHVDVVIPGHGAIAQRPEVAARFAADRAYLDALRQGEEPVDARWGPRG